MVDAFVNGERVTPTALPGWTDYDCRVLIYDYDVARFLRRGENVLELRLGNGWYNLLPMKMWGRYNLRENLPQGTPCVHATLVAATDDFPEIPNPEGNNYGPVESFPESLFVIRGYNIQTRNIVHRATTATFEDDYILPEQSVTPPKYENHFESPGKYPGCVTLYQQRLVLASTDLQPSSRLISGPA